MILCTRTRFMGKGEFARSRDGALAHSELGPSFRLGRDSMRPSP